MTIREAAFHASNRLSATGIETPWLDAWVLLAHILDTDREHLFASYTNPIDQTVVDELDRLIEKRLEGYPVSYLIGRKEFYGLTFAVDERVLVPRPDTEVLVESVLATVDGNQWIERVHDCCTGSGCVAIAIAHERPHLDVSGSDVSAEAIEVAKLNSRRILNRELAFSVTDILPSLPTRYHLITANAPYIPADEYEAMKRSGWPEPRVALEAGPDGLDVYRRLIPASVDSLCKGGYLFVEAADNQSDRVRRLLLQSGFSAVGAAEDLGGRRRVCWGRLEA